MFLIFLWGMMKISPAHDQHGLKLVCFSCRKHYIVYFTRYEVQSYSSPFNNVSFFGYQYCFLISDHSRSSNILKLQNIQETLPLIGFWSILALIPCLSGDLLFIREAILTLITVLMGCINVGSSGWDGVEGSGLFSTSQKFSTHTVTYFLTLVKSFLSLYLMGPDLNESVLVTCLAILYMVSLTWIIPS